jgi:hypothetical protein
MVSNSSSRSKRQTAETLEFGLEVTVNLQRAVWQKVLEKIPEEGEVGKRRKLIDIIHVTRVISEHREEQDQTL